METTLTSAPFFMSYITTSGFSALASNAYIIGVRYFLSFKLTCTSYCNRKSTISMYPF